MSGILTAVVNLAFAKTTVTYSTAGTFTETIPSRATSVQVEAWGPGAQGGAAGASKGGGGAGGGGYSRVTISVAGKNGQTFIVMVGTNQNGALLTHTKVNPGSITGFTSILAGTGGNGTAGNGTAGAGGPGGTATNANSGAVNTNGNNGTAGGNVFTGGTGGAGIAGAGNGGPFGTGGWGAISNGNLVGQDGGVLFTYT